MKVAKKLFLVNSLIAEVRASVPPDPFANLDERQRNILRSYQRTTPLVEQAEHLIKGTSPIEAICSVPFLPASLSAQDFVERYERDVRELARFRMFKGIQ